MKEAGSFYKIIENKYLNAKAITNMRIKARPTNTKEFLIFCESSNTNGVKIPKVMANTIFSVVTSKCPSFIHSKRMGKNKKPIVKAKKVKAILIEFFIVSFRSVSIYTDLTSKCRIL